MCRIRDNHRAAILLAWLLAVLPLAGCGDEAAVSVRASATTVPDVFEVEVTGSNFEWLVRYPGPDGRLGTADDTHARRDLHVPVNSTIRIHMRSRDYIYNLALPHLGLKEVAVPDMEFSMEFKADETGEFELRGDQMCGWTHPLLMGRLYVESHEDFQPPE